MYLHDLTAESAGPSPVGIGYGGTSLIPEDAEQGPPKQRVGFDVPKRVEQPKETRLEFLRRRVNEIRGRGYTKSEEVNLLSEWLDEALTLVETAKATPTGAAQ